MAKERHPAPAPRSRRRFLRQGAAVAASTMMPTTLVEALTPTVHKVVKPDVFRTTLEIEIVKNAKGEVERVRIVYADWEMRLKGKKIAILDENAEPRDATHRDESVRPFAIADASERDEDGEEQKTTNTDGAQAGARKRSRARTRRDKARRTAMRLRTRRLASRRRTRRSRRGRGQAKRLTIVTARMPQERNIVQSHDRAEHAHAQTHQQQRRYAR